jgi:hypothetical protein
VSYGLQTKSVAVDGDVYLISSLCKQSGHPICLLIAEDGIEAGWIASGYSGEERKARAIIEGLEFEVDMDYENILYVGHDDQGELLISRRAHDLLADFDLAKFLSDNQSRNPDLKGH